MNIKEMLDSKKEEITLLINKGESNTNIARQFNCSRASLVNFLRRNNLLTNPDPKTTNKVNDKKEEIISLFEAGMTVTNIGKELNISYSSVNKALKKWGYEVERRSSWAPLLEENKDKIFAQIEEGLSCVKIAKDYGCHATSILDFLKRYGKSSTFKRSERYGLVPKNKDKIIELWNSGLKCTQISKELDLQYTGIVDSLKKWGYDTSKHCSAKKDHIPVSKRTNEILELYKNHTVSDISNKLGYADCSIKKILIKHNTTIRNTIHNVNEHYMDKIDNHDKAYILGLFYADGNIVENKKIRISLEQTDKPLLEKIKEKFEYTGQVSRVKNDNQCELCISRKYLADKFTSLGCPPKKSHILKYPAENILPIQFTQSFIAGYVMGDGSVTKKYISVCGNKDFILPLAEIIKREADYTNIYQKVNENTGNVNYNIMLGRGEDRINFATWIYSDILTDLYNYDRKYQNYLKYLPQWFT